MKNAFWAIGLLVSTLSVVSCKLYLDEPDSDIVTELRNVRNFHALNIKGVAKVEVRIGSEYRVEITTEENLMDQVSAVEQNGVLVIMQTTPNFNFGDRLKVVVVAPFWDGFTLGEVVDINVANPIKGSRLDISASGSSKLQIPQLQFEAIHLKQNGTSDVILGGSANGLHATLSGAAQLQALACPVITALAELHGSSLAKVNVSTLLQVKAAGSSEVQYKGNAEVKSQVLGTGRVFKI
jgi:Putative auto-transporter adhesin, head GIN domain